MELFCILAVVVVTPIDTRNEMIYRAKHAHTHTNACKIFTACKNLKKVNGFLQFQFSGYDAVQ